MLASHFLRIVYVLFLILVYLQIFFELVVSKQFDLIKVSDFPLKQPTAIFIDIAYHAIACLLRTTNVLSYS